METYEILFWTSLLVVFYTYIGYGICLIALVKIKEFFLKRSTGSSTPIEPAVTMFVAAYNEEDFIEQKIQNMFALDYPKEKLEILFVTDGSTDGSVSLLKKYDEVKVLHEDKRGGKIGAINRGMKEVSNPIVIFSDANAMLNKDAVRNIVKHYVDPKIGCVSGEKRIHNKQEDVASGAGEGIYWKYESLLKDYDYRLYSAVGAAGELFSIRTELHESLEKDTLLDDFIISLRIAQKGFKIAYEPKAFAVESSSASIAEEMKRKVRISAGGIQSIIRLGALFNLSKHGLLSFQFVSHRVLRWTLTPFALISLLPLNIILSWYTQAVFYDVLLVAQLSFYGFAALGWVLENNQIKIKVLFVPFYFLFMNLCVILGIVRYFKGNQSVLWDKAKRA